MDNAMDENNKRSYFFYYDFNNTIDNIIGKYYVQVKVNAHLYAPKESMTSYSQTTPTFVRCLYVERFDTLNHRLEK